MSELWLNFTDPDGINRRVRVGGAKFVIGRHSDCDLFIPDSRLSRVHAQINRFGDRWEISDAGSSNGTEIFGNPIVDPVPVFDGNNISLGGLEIRAEICEAASEAVTAEPAAIPVAAPVAKTSNPPEGAIPLALILAAPVAALVLVAVVGLVIYLVVAQDPGTTAANDDDDPIISTRDDRPGKDKDDPPTKNGNDPPPKSPGTSANGSTVPGNSDLPTATPANLSETAKVEANGAGFLRKIAQNDNNSFLTKEQAKQVSGKVKQLSGNSAVADNIKAAQKNAAEIKSLADGKSLKPQFLAIAAIARLGTSRGDVVQTARSMSEVLGKLRTPIGNEFPDDCLLMIAAYDQGAAGETMKMRNMLQNLATEVNDSSRTIRTIWFLQKRGKITQAEFDRALSFLAIGTIAQNPKDFSVNVEALNIS